MHPFEFDLKNIFYFFSSTGGVLGLFCGVSILSVVEAAVWAARILSSAVLSGGNKKSGMKVHRMDE